MKIETTNTEAYEYYLKGKFKYETRKIKEDTQIAEGFLKKSIELDNNLLSPKNLLGRLYFYINKNDESKKIWTITLKQAEELGDKNMMANALVGIGNTYYYQADYEKALPCFYRSVDIYEEIENQGLGVYDADGDLTTPLVNTRECDFVI